MFILIASSSVLRFIKTEVQIVWYLSEHFDNGDRWGILSLLCFGRYFIEHGIAIGVDMCIHILAPNILLRLAQRCKPIKSSNSHYWIMNTVLCLSSKKMCADMCHFPIAFQGKIWLDFWLYRCDKISVGPALISLWFYYWNSSGKFWWTTQEKRKSV